MTKVSASQVRCPVCNAPPGEPCFTRSYRMHWRRLMKARRKGSLRVVG